MRVPLFRQAQERLRQHILDHGLSPGDPLPSEGELAEQFEVSRASMREATRSLESLGVIESRHGKGLYVGQFSFAPILEQLPYGLLLNDVSFREVLEVRHALEEQLILKASKLLTERDLRDLGEIVQRMRDQQVDGRPPPEVDWEFHQRLFTPLGNQLVLDMIDIFWRLYNRIGEQLPGQRPHAVEVHADIVDALATGDPTAITTAVTRHFVAIEQAVEVHEARSTATDDKEHPHS